jgi:hypothetical protein
MREWVVIGAACAFIGVVALLAHGCGGGPPEEEAGELTAAEKSAVEGFRKIELDYTFR